MSLEGGLWASSHPSVDSPSQLRPLVLKYRSTYVNYTPPANKTFNFQLPITNSELFMNLKNASQYDPFFPNLFLFLGLLCTLSLNHNEIMRHSLEYI